MRFTFLLVTALICYTVVYILLQHNITAGKMEKLKNLEGKNLSATDLRKQIPRGLSVLADKKEFVFFESFMNIHLPDNSNIYKVTGKGIPNYYGIIIFDSTENSVKNVYVKELN